LHFILEKRCGTGSGSWCCSSKLKNRSFFYLFSFLFTIVSFVLVTATCSNYKCYHTSSSYKRTLTDTDFDTLFFIIFSGTVFCICCYWNPRCSHSEANSLENSAVNNCSTIQRVRTSIQPFPVSTSSAMNTEQSMNNYPLRLLSTQSSIRTTPRRNPTASLEQPPPEYNNSSIRRETTISLEEHEAPSSPPPPAYNDVIQQRSTTIIMEQQSLLPPPTYNDSIREN
jgi:hypothetical protein